VQNPIGCPLAANGILCLTQAGGVGEMKVKSFVAFCVVGICVLFAGCALFATEEQEIVRDMYTSREGVLSGGHEFTFRGADQTSGLLVDKLERMGFAYRRTYDFIVQEETIEEMLENPDIQRHLIDSAWPEDVIINVLYFAECNNIVFELELLRAHWMGLPSSHSGKL